MNKTEAVINLFQSRPNEWISAIALEPVGGRLGWRTRVSEARKAGLNIENKVTRWKDGAGNKFVFSAYRLVR